MCASDTAWLTLAETADALGVSVMTADRLLTSGKLRVQRDGHRWRVPLDAITQYQQAQEHAAGARADSWRSAAEAAAALGISLDALYQRIHRGRIATVRAPDGRRWVSIDEIERQLRRARGGRLCAAAITA